MPPEGRDAVLDVRGAARSFSSRKALDGVSLRLGPGEVIAVLGRNGAGKSTLLKASIGALRLDAGSVLVLGRDPFAHPDVRRHIGLAPQEIALWGHLTVRENLEAAAAIGGVPRRERAEAVDRALEAACCSERAEDQVGRLSGGWRRRANLAAALVHGPKLLVLDEPGEGLDAAMRAHLSALVRVQRQAGAGVLVVSHDMEEVLNLADRVVVLEGGRVVAEGGPRDLLALAFGRRRELVVRPRDGADGERAQGLLLGLGLRPLGDGRGFGSLAEDPWSLAREAQSRLEGAGVAEAEAMVRAPGLDALIDWARARGAA